MYIDELINRLHEMMNEIDPIEHKKDAGNGVCYRGCRCDSKASHPKKMELPKKRELPFTKVNDISRDIKHVIFNDPATIVVFSDGTKVCVKTCGTDKFSKEIGLVYAIVKRLYANGVDRNGYLKSNSLGDKIDKIIKNAIDQKEVAHQKKIKKQN